jgi:hypothetical protein
MRRTMGSSSPRFSSTSKAFSGAAEQLSLAYEPVRSAVEAERWDGLYLFRERARGDFIEPKNALNKDTREAVLSP